MFTIDPSLQQMLQKQHFGPWHSGTLWQVTSDRRHSLTPPPSVKCSDKISLQAPSRSDFILQWGDWVTFCLASRRLSWLTHSQFYWHCLHCIQVSTDITHTTLFTKAWQIQSIDINVRKENKYMYKQKINRSNLNYYKLENEIVTVCLTYSVHVPQCFDRHSIICYQI